MSTHYSPAIANLYLEFSGYGFERLGAVPDECVSDDLHQQVTAQLVAADLRLLDGAALLDYYYLAVDHLGTVDDLRHFLPRILELMVDDPNGYLSPALLPDVLKRADVRSMSHSQRAALQRFLEHAARVLPSKVLEESLKVLQAPA